MEKTKRTSGADESAPSLPQYFSWINNTNEGSTERQTLINLEYFKWLHDYYGMKLKIYAMDCGNLDGAGGTYENFDGDKLKVQFPNKYKPCVDKAAEFGCRLGVWGGADGFGNTPEEEKARMDLMVGLCKDYGFMLFKFDTVCGELRKEKRDAFLNMINECRKYSPDLIVLNHRNNLGEAEICATTFLWGGEETYVDIFLLNKRTGSHHRAGIFERGLVPDLKRLTEDHGVCISSCIDYFEDDLILQAFSRNLILAPEIYGNPWLMRDIEQARMARIYNIHEKYNDILVCGMTLPDSYGQYAVARGNGQTRLITLRNGTWKTEKIKILLTEEIGLSKCKSAAVKIYHPYETFKGIYEYGDAVEIETLPFRALLLAVVEEETFNKNEYALTNCEYEVLREVDGKPCEINILKTNGQSIGSVGRHKLKLDNINLPVIDVTIHAPVKLGTMTKCGIPENIEQLYEATMFKANNDAFEAQSLKRSGATSVPQVLSAREAFFTQKTYKYRGCENKNIFDGDPDTFFDANTRYYGTRIEGGCLRVDLNEVYDISYIEIECFKINEPIKEVLEFNVPASGSYSVDLLNWKTTELKEIVETGDCAAPVVKHGIHNIVEYDGKRMKVIYEIGDKMRYFRLPEPMDRIYSFKAIDRNGAELKLDHTRANNMMAVYEKKQASAVKKLNIKLPGNFIPGSYIAVAIEGIHGVEGAYCGAEIGKEPIGFDDRAVSYPINNWEHIVCATDRYNTYYLHLTEDMREKEITVYTMFTDVMKSDIPCDVYLCEGNIDNGTKIEIIP